MMKLPVSAGDYACTWSINGATVGGQLMLVESGRPQGTAFDVPGVGTTTSAADGSQFVRFSPYEESVERVRGQLRSGHDVVLIGASLGHVFPGTAQLTGEMALCGFGLPAGDEILFDTVQFQVGGLTELSGVAPIPKIQWPSSDTPEPTFSASWNKEVDQEWSTDTGDRITLNYTAYMSFQPGYQLEVSAQPIVEVSGVRRKAGEWIEAYVKPLAELTTFATARKQPVCWVQFISRSAEPNYTAQAFAAEITQEPYRSLAPEPRVLAPLLRLGPEGASLPDLLDGWKALQAKYDTFSDYLSSALREEMTLKSRFLALVPAIESFHTEKYGDGPQSRKEYTKQRKEVLRRVAAVEGVAGDDVEWLRKWVNALGSYQLQERLHQLLNDLPEGLQQRLRALTDPLPESLEDCRADLGDVWKIMGKVRNNLAHGGDQPTAQALRTLTLLAHTMAVGLALQELGVPGEPLAHAIDGGKWVVV